MEFLEELHKERKALLNKLEAINLLLNAYGEADGVFDELTDKDTLIGRFTQGIGNVNKEFVKIGEKMIFPKFGRKDKQVLWIFNNCFNQGIKISEIQEKYNELAGFTEDGKTIRIDNVSRRLKRNGKLVIVKYNKQNKASFWGLPEWVNEEGFKEGYSPNENALPLDIEHIEVFK